MKKSVVVKIGKDKYKIIPPNKYFVNRNTPLGDDSNYYEIKPYNGRKYIEPLLFITEDGKVEHYKYLSFDYTKGEWGPKNVTKSLETYLNNLNYDKSKSN